MYWEAHNNIHIDELFNFPIDKSDWIKYTLNVKSSLYKLVDFNKYSILICISTEYTATQETDVTTFTLNKIQKLQGESPPAIYLYPKSNDTINDTINGLKTISLVNEGINEKVYIREFTEDDFFYYIIYIPIFKSDNNI